MRTEYVRCSRCGELKATDHECYLRRLKRYGSVAKMEAEWQCSQCKHDNSDNKKPVELDRKARSAQLLREFGRWYKQSIPYYEGEKDK